MDAHHFDTLTRSLTTSVSRRGALVAALGSVLGVIGMGETEEAEAGGCKPTCGSCEACKKGKCKKKKHGKKCKKGTCRPQADGTACANGNNCQSGICTCTLQSLECPTGCSCQLAEVGGTPICMENAATGAPSCDDCPAGTVMCQVGGMGFLCYRACGT